MRYSARGAASLLLPPLVLAGWSTRATRARGGTAGDKEGEEDNNNDDDDNDRNDVGENEGGRNRLWLLRTTTLLLLLPLLRLLPPRGYTKSVVFPPPQNGLAHPPTNADADADSSAAGGLRRPRE